MRPALRALVAVIGVTLSVAVLPTVAVAESQPAIERVAVSFVTQHDAGLEATINPEGLSARGAVYQFQVVANPSEYLAEIACPVREHSGLGGGGCIGTPTPGALPIGSIPSSTKGRSVSVELNAAGMDLKPGTTYHYRVLAATAKVSEDTLEWEAPPAYSEDQTFTTPPAKTTTPPVIESESASHVTATDATLEAKINPENLERGALYQFQLVTNTDEYLPVFVCPAGWAESSLCLGLDTEVEGLPTRVTSAGKEGQAVSLDLAEAGKGTGRPGVTLKPGTTYRYRVIAATSVLTEDTTDWEGPIVEGSDQTFTTPQTGAPVVNSVSVSHLTPTDATLEATIDTEGQSTMYEFLLWYNPCAECEDLGPVFKVDLPSGLLLPSFQDQSVSLDLNSVGVTLKPAAEYNYSLRATNASGSAEAQGRAFQPPPGVVDPPGPVIDPGPVSNEPEVPLGAGQHPTSSANGSSAPAGGSTQAGMTAKQPGTGKPSTKHGKRREHKHHGKKTAKHPAKNK